MICSAVPTTTYPFKEIILSSEFVSNGNLIVGSEKTPYTISVCGGCGCDLSSKNDKAAYLVNGKTVCVVCIPENTDPIYLGNKKKVNRNG